MAIHAWESYQLSKNSIPQLVHMAGTYVNRYLQVSHPYLQKKNCIYNLLWNIFRTAIVPLTGTNYRHKMGSLKTQDSPGTSKTKTSQNPQSTVVLGKTIYKVASPEPFMDLASQRQYVGTHRVDSPRRCKIPTPRVLQIAEVPCEGILLEKCRKHCPATAGRGLANGRCSIQGTLLNNNADTKDVRTLDEEYKCLFGVLIEAKCLGDVEDDGWEVVN